MTAGPEQQDAQLRTALVDWLTRGQGHHDVVVDAVSRPSSGYSSDTIFVGASWDEAGTRRRQELVVRMAPRGGATFPSYDLEAELQAVHAAAEVGVPVAAPRLEAEPGWLGAPFLVMPRIDGHVVGSVAHHDRWLGTLGDDGRGRLYLNLLAEMCRVHQAAVSADTAVPRRDLEAELTYWDTYLQWSSDGSPVATLCLALEWCRANQPSDEPEACLLWGDVRFENAIFGDDLAVRAVLDWDMTSIGAPEHDLAWFTSLDLTMEHLFGRRAGGFPDRSETVARFEELEGRPAQHLPWHETLAMVRATAIMTRIGYLQRDAGHPPMLPIDDNPILDLLRSRLD